MTAWIGANPFNTEDAYLMINPEGSWSPAARPAPKMLELIDVLHLHLGEMTPDVPGLSAVLTGDHVSLCTYGETMAERPVSSEWAAMARRERRVVLVVGAVAFGGDLDKYVTDHADTCALALVPVVP